MAAVESQEEIDQHIEASAQMFSPRRTLCMRVPVCFLAACVVVPPQSDGWKDPPFRLVLFFEPSVAQFVCHTADSIALCLSFSRPPFVHHFAGVQKNKRALVGTFDSAENPLRENFKKIAEQLRDECHFVVHDGSSDVGESGASVKFKSTRDTDLFMGDLADHDSLFAWARDHCNPMVREITFENGEELTEEGLPFLIMFYDPANHDPVDDFTKIVNSRFPQERGNINFITADGTKFAHPLRHLGMAKTDLPVLAFDTFKHMHLFKQFSNVYREGILEKFVDDLHSGKLHHNFHHPPAAGEEEVYEKDISNQIEGAGAKAAPAGDGGAAAPDASADAPTVETPVAQPHDEGHPEDHEKDPEETLKEKLEEAEKQKRPDVPVSTPKPKAQGHAEEHEDEDAEDMSKPVVVKSILKNLKPSNNRYSFNHNRDEF
jgi:endoplasmic reticulum resident protein 44